MAGKMRESVQIVKKTFQEFSQDDCLTMAAALAYYTIFSLPALLVLSITIAGVVWAPEQIEGEVHDQIADVVGPQGAEAARTMLEAAREPGRGTMGWLFGLAILAFSATGALAQLQYTLDRIWSVAPDPERGGVKNFLMKRVLSFALILVIAFLLLASLLLTTVLSRMGPLLETWLPIAIPAVVFLIANELLSFLIVTLLFAAMFKVLPDAHVAWREVWVGAFVTAALFTIGRFALGFYLGRQEMEAFGAAAALAFLLLWIYYSAVIFFIGAEFAQVWARRHGKAIAPAHGAVEKQYHRHKPGGPTPAPG